MLLNLKAEMARRSLTNEDIHKVIGKTTKTVQEKIKGNVPITFPEAIAIRDALFPGLTLEYLFAQDTTQEERG